VIGGAPLPQAQALGIELDQLLAPRQVERYADEGRQDDDHSHCG